MLFVPAHVLVVVVVVFLVVVVVVVVVCVCGGGGGIFDSSVFAPTSLRSPCSYLALFFFPYKCIVLIRFLPWEIWVAFPGESQLRQSRATQHMEHAGRLSVYTIHRTLPWTTGSLTCAQM